MGHDVCSKYKKHVPMLPSGINGYDSQQKRKNHQYFFYVGTSRSIHYSASKAAVIGLTKALAKEVGPSHIQVNCVAPGVIKTAMNSHLDKQTLEMLKEETPLGVIGTTEDVAQMVGFLASDHSDFITGQVFGINGGMVI